MLKMFALSSLPFLLFFLSFFYFCILLFCVPFHHICHYISVMNVQRCAIFAAIDFSIQTEAFQKLSQVGRHGVHQLHIFFNQLHGYFAK